MVRRVSKRLRVAVEPFNSSAGISSTSHLHLICISSASHLHLIIASASHQVLGLVDDLRNHPFASFVSEGMPVVLSSDDPGFWGADGVAYDWVVAFLLPAQPCTGIALLKQLAHNSIAYSAVDSARRAALEAEWSVRWQAYVEWLVTAFGTD